MRPAGSAYESQLVIDFLLRRFDPQHCAEICVRQQVQQPVGSLAYVPYPLFELDKHPFTRVATGWLPLPVELDPLEVVVRQRADEDISLPTGKPIAGVKAQAGYRNRR